MIVYPLYIRAFQNGGLHQSSNPLLSTNSSVADIPAFVKAEARRDEILDTDDDLRRPN